MIVSRVLDGSASHLSGTESIIFNVMQYNLVVYFLVYHVNISVAVF